MVTANSGTEEEEELDLSAGMVPLHNLGPVTGYDHDSGLPIVKRGHAQSAQPSNPVAKPEVETKPAAEEKPAAIETKPAKEETPEPASKTKESSTDTKPEMSKGSMVRLPDGRTGKIAHIAQGAGITRVKLDGGGDVSVRSSALTPLRHVQVAAHTRKVPIQ